MQKGYRIQQEYACQCDYFKLFKAINLQGNQQKQVQIKVIDFTLMKAISSYDQIEYTKYLDKQIYIHSNVPQDSHILPYFQIFKQAQPERLYIVSEIVNSINLIYSIVILVSLRDKFKNNQYPTQEQALNYLSQIIKALQFQKQYNIYHQELCPEYIQFNKNDELFLVNFGQPNDSFKLIEKIQDNFHYKSYEYYESTSDPQKNDIWSLGIILYETIFQEVPFQKPKFQEIQATIMLKCKNIKQLIKDASQKKKVRINQEISSLIENMLKFNKSERISYEEIELNIVKIQENIKKNKLDGQLYSIAIILTLKEELERNNQLKQVYGDQLLGKIIENLDYKMHGENNKLSKNCVSIQEHHFTPNIEQNLIVLINQLNKNSLILVAETIEILTYNVLDKLDYKEDLQQHIKKIEQEMHLYELIQLIQSRIRMNQA